MKKNKKIADLPEYTINEPGPETGIRNIMFDKYGLENKLTIDVENRTISGVLIEANKRIYRNDDGQGYYIVFTPEVIEKISRKISIGCPIFIDENTKGELVNKSIKDGSLYITSKIEDDQFWNSNYKSYSLWFDGLFAQKLKGIDGLIDEVKDDNELIKSADEIINANGEITASGRIKFVCAVCKSENVREEKIVATYLNTLEQEEFITGYYCLECEDETKVIEQ